MSKLYGSLINRFEQNSNFLNRDIMPGDDITMYYWSDRTCYYVTKVVNQKHIFVKPYEVCADHDKPGGIGHQNWKYFKTVAEINTYFKAHNLSAYDNVYENSEQEWVYRYNKWWQKINGKYYKLQPISFGVRDYYYDWSF